ncbi:MAG: PorT family protein [Saprospiraceae bacterium]|mgnify:FL=1|nr:PorT family protein [Saprospiraceae bacterium]MCB0604172.1 PorT family protein [Saprospiraceae bacterium]MCO5278875.1 PorT family protein [Saprospiraceae bacterium]
MRLNKLSILVFALFVTMQTYGQTTINPKIGLNFSHLSGKPEVGKNEVRIGFNIGFDLRFGERFQFAPGIHYAIHGMAFDGALAADSLDRIALHLIKIPLLANVNVINSNFFRLRLYGGWMNNILLKVDNNKYLAKEDMNIYTGGILFGTGVDLSGLTLDLSYEVGMLDMFKGGFMVNTIYPQNTQNNVLTLSVGVRVSN